MLPLRPVDARDILSLFFTVSPSIPADGGPEPSCPFPPVALFCSAVTAAAMAVAAAADARFDFADAGDFFLGEGDAPPPAAAAAAADTARGFPGGLCRGGRGLRGGVMAPPFSPPRELAAAARPVLFGEVGRRPTAPPPQPPLIIAGEAFLFACEPDPDCTSLAPPPPSLLAAAAAPAAAVLLANFLPVAPAPAVPAFLEAEVGVFLGDVAGWDWRLPLLVGGAVQPAGSGCRR